MKCQVVDAIFSGGGVVAEFSRDLPESTRFSGGGVVAEFFRGLHTADATHTIHLADAIHQWGGGDASNFPLMGPLNRPLQQHSCLPPKESPPSTNIGQETGLRDSR